MFMRVQILGLLCLGVVASSPANSSADFVVNGGFEQNPAGYYTTYNAGSTGITGWTVINGTNATAAGSVDLLGGFMPAHSGSQAVDLDGTGGPSVVGGLQQTITGLTAGTTYVLDFFYANNVGVAGGSAQVNIAGITRTFAHTGSTSAAPGYTELTFNFIAAGSSQVLTFQSTDPAGSNGGVVLDDVSINVAPSAVPEPSSVALLGLGLGGAGVVARCRRPCRA